MRYMHIFVDTAATYGNAERESSMSVGMAITMVMFQCDFGSV